MAETLRRVEPAEAIRDWDWYERQIWRVIDRADGGQTPDDILSCIQRDTMQLWRTVDKRGMVITELQRSPRYVSMLIYMVAGEGLKDWMAGAGQQLEDFAKAHGCSRMEFHGRPGWAKYAASWGYTHLMIRMKKRLD